jgi:hypothetical protein
MSKDTKIISLLENAGEIVDEAAKEILQYTPQLFCRPEAGPLRPQAIASGVLLKVNENHFLVTAAHVLKGVSPDKIGIMIGSDFYILNGEVKYTDVSLSAINDKVDLTVWKLQKDVSDDIARRYRFLDSNHLGDRHNVNTRLRYLVVGFPVSQTKYNPVKKAIRSNPLVYLTKIAEPKYYEKLFLIVRKVY